MVCLDLASLDRVPKRGRTDPEDVSRLRQIHHPSDGAIAIIARDVVLRAEGDHTLSCPAIATSGQEPI
jgi:hypothetical protein